MTTRAGEDAAAVPAHLRTIRDVLRHGVTRFSESGLYFGHGHVDAFAEAAYLALHALHLPHGRLETFLDARLDPAEIGAVLALFHRRIASRLPAAYLTHEAWLGEWRFYVDERVLVPRSFIAELLMRGLDPWVGDPTAVARVLDLCTGSGCLAILAALAFDGARVDAVDLSPDALDVARRNIADYDLADRVAPKQSDMFKALEGEVYDLIVSNPPYVRADSMGKLPEEYRREPQLGLASGADGLDHIRVILRDAANHLSADGILVVEAGHNRATLEAAFPTLPFTWLETEGGPDFVFLLRRADLAPAARARRK